MDISLIDDLFAYRFRLALNNPTFRRILLVRYDYAYVNIYNVMKEVYDVLDDKSLYVYDDIEYVKPHISNAGFAVIAYSKEDKIVGSFIFRYPDMQEDNLGRDIKYDGLMRRIYLKEV